MSNMNGNKRTRASKFEVLKNKRKSLIPLPTSTKSPVPEFHLKLPQQHQSPPRLTAKVSCALRHKLRGVHSSTIPFNDNDANENFSNHPCPSAEGCNLVTSKTLTDTGPTSKHLLTWNSDDTIIIKIEANETNTISPSWSLIACTPEPEVHSQLQIPPEHLQTSYALAILADKACRMAFRTRGYFLCPICNEPFSRPAIIACGHLHCMQCVSNWFEDQDSCPCCRYRIVVKEVNNALLAKDFFEVNTLLASIFTAGNFHDSINEHVKERTPVESSDPTYQSPLTNFIAATFKQIFQQESTLPWGEISKWCDPKIREGHCFISALWFSRQMLGLVNSPSSETTFSTSGPTVEKLREVLNLETIHGNRRSRESFLKTVMTTPRLNYESCKGNFHFTIPHSCLKNSRKKTLVNDPTGRGYPRLRFRLPTMQTVWKLILTGCIFVAIALAVRIFDLRSIRFKDDEKGVNFLNLDFFVFVVSVFSMAAYTESERMTFWRRRGRGRGNNRGRQVYPGLLR